MVFGGINLDGPRSTQVDATQVDPGLTQVDRGLTHVDAQLDPAICGGCGRACGAGEVSASCLLSSFAAYADDQRDAIEATLIVCVIRR